MSTIVLVIVIVIAIVAVRYIKRSIEAKKRKREEEERKLADAKQQQHRSDLATRVAAGDEAAKQEIIELGTGVSYDFFYHNYDFDKAALQRVYDLTVAAMTAKGIPFAFVMDGVNNNVVGNNSLSVNTWDGKTTNGETIHIQYQIGKAKPGEINYSLHLKQLPEVVQDIGGMVQKGMKEFLSTVPEWKP
jgi:type II secretory pathway pseudopilin PulG